MLYPISASPELTFSIMAPVLVYTLTFASPRALAISQKPLLFLRSCVRYEKPTPLRSGS